MPLPLPSFLRRFGKPSDGMGEGPQTPDRVAVIGDLHGCYGLLDRLIHRLVYQADTFVFVGDYVDRGRDSGRVLSTLFEWQTGHSNLHCLAGNHEEMLLAFLDDPVKNGPPWMRHGGLQTLASFDIFIAPDMEMRPDLLEQARDDLRARLGGALEQWLRDLPLIWTTGTLAVSHAGAAPRKPIWDQTPRDLLWGHPDFRREVRQDGIWVAHGHWIHALPGAEAGRIAVDTGAYATGFLSAAVITDGQISFLSEGGDR